MEGIDEGRGVGKEEMGRRMPTSMKQGDGEAHGSVSLDIMRQPSEALSIPHAANDGAHENFDWPDIALFDILVLLGILAGCVDKPKHRSQLILCKGERESSPCLSLTGALGPFLP